MNQEEIIPTESSATITNSAEEKIYPRCGNKLILRTAKKVPMQVDSSTAAVVFLNVDMLKNYKITKQGNKVHFEVGNELYFFGFLSLF